jgi:hypothetical protein
MSDLLPCPFCGDKDPTHEKGLDPYFGELVICESCEATARTPALWNARASIPTQERG